MITSAAMMLNALSILICPVTTAVSKTKTSKRQGGFTLQCGSAYIFLREAVWWIILARSLLYQWDIKLERGWWWMMVMSYFHLSNLVGWGNNLLGCVPEDKNYLIEFVTFSWTYVHCINLIRCYASFNTNTMLSCNMWNAITQQPDTSFVKSCFRSAIIWLHQLFHRS